MKTITIKDFGATENTLCTGQIQAALDSLSGCGGTVIFPAGHFLSGALRLHSNTRVVFAAGCHLKASGNIEDFPYIGFYHGELGHTKSLMYAMNAENITLCGDGTIDFSDEDYCLFDKPIPFETNMDALSESQKAECVVERRYDMEKTLSQPMFFESCKNVTVKDIKLMHAPVWTLTLSRCEEVYISSLTVDNRRMVGNSDGIHLCGCKNVVIHGCNIKAGDDCVAITGITDYSAVSENIVISDCNFESSSAGIRLGHMASKVKNVCISNINITNSNRGIAIFTHNGGHIRNVTVQGLNIATKVFCGAWWGKGEPLVICAADSDGVIENVSLSNIFAESENGLIIAGKNENIKNIQIQNFSLTLRDSENRRLFGTDIDLRPNAYQGREGGAAFDRYIEHAQVRFEGFYCYRE